MSIVVLPQCGQPLVAHPVQEQQVIVESAMQGPLVVYPVQEQQVIVESAMQGPPGKNGDPSGALLIDNRLNEFAGNAAAQEQAQANLGLGVADPLAYYILAKS